MQRAYMTVLPTPLQKSLKMSHKPFDEDGLHLQVAMHKVSA